MSLYRRFYRKPECIKGLERAVDGCWAKKDRCPRRERALNYFKKWIERRKGAINLSINFSYYEQGKIFSLQSHIFLLIVRLYRRKPSLDTWKKIYMYHLFKMKLIEIDSSWNITWVAYFVSRNKLRMIKPTVMYLNTIQWEGRIPYTEAQNLHVRRCIVVWKI